VVAGLVAITPSCGAVDVYGALLIGVAAGALCAYAVGLKYKFGYDDSLDVVGVHLVGGLWGTLAVGLFLAPGSPAAISYERTGLLYGGGVSQLWRQAVGAFSVLIFSFVLTLLIGLILQKTIGFRVTEDEEREGVDSTEHAETGYDLGGFGGGARAVGSSGFAPRHAESENANDQEVSA
jgi:Amt family ammonium transporter